MSGDTTPNLSFSGTELLSKSSALQNLEINEVAFVSSASVITEPPLHHLLDLKNELQELQVVKGGHPLFSQDFPNSFE